MDQSCTRLPSSCYKVGSWCGSAAGSAAESQLRQKFLGRVGTRVWPGRSWKSCGRPPVPRVRVGGPPLSRRPRVRCRVRFPDDLLDGYDPLPQHKAAARLHQPEEGGQAVRPGRAPDEALIKGILGVKEGRWHQLYGRGSPDGQPPAVRRAEGHRLERAGARPVLVGQQAEVPIPPHGGRQARAECARDPPVRLHPGV